MTLTLPAEEESSPSLSYRGDASPAAPCTFMCLRSDEGCVYDLSQPCTRQLYGLSDVCTCECFFLSEEFANRRSQPAYSHLNGFSPVDKQKYLLKGILILMLFYKF